MNKNIDSDSENKGKNTTERPKCGLVMPIATFGDYPQSHWSSVESILRESLDDIGFEAKLVSQETTSGVIHQRIIANLYTNDIVVCDVSARNPNVMFELGMRLAFDKPTIIVKDDETPFSFDISSIEHLTYPRLLTYADIVGFKKLLGEKVLATTELASKDKNYSTFLKHITGVKPAKINIQEIPFQEFIVKQLEEIRSSINRNSPRSENQNALLEYGIKGQKVNNGYEIDVSDLSEQKQNEIVHDILSIMRPPSVYTHSDGIKKMVSFRSDSTRKSIEPLLDIISKYDLPPDSFRRAYID